MIFAEGSHTWSIESIIGGCVAVIVAGMPAVLALLKIRELHILINSRLSELIALTEKAAHSAGVNEGREQGIEEYFKISKITPEAGKVLLTEAAEKARILLAEAAEKANKLMEEEERKKKKNEIHHFINLFFNFDITISYNYIPDKYIAFKSS